MEVIEGIELLQQTAERLRSDLPLTFDAASEFTVNQVANVLPLSAELRRAYEQGAPAGAFPSFVQLSTLDRVEELGARQVGYAVNENGDSFPEWDSGWIVIGADGGDPFIAHVDRVGTPVSVAIHGTGTWKPLPVAHTLGSFFALVAIWSSLLIEDFDGSMLDEGRDFEVKDGFWQALALRLSPVLTEREVVAFRSYLDT